MTNQIPEDVKQKISELANAYGIVPAFSNQTRIDHDRILHYIAGATGGYTLGLKSAEKRVKELEDGLKKAVAIIKDWHQADDVWDIYFNNAPEMKPIKQLLSK